MEFNYITIGNDCSPAVALRSLGLRNAALPFDWVVSNVNALRLCFETDFDKFHTGLVLNNTHKRLIDSYGFEFPHDYPLDNTNLEMDRIGEGSISEEDGKVITHNWLDYYEIVLDKYKRRIERFRNIMNDIKPVIVLCRHSTSDVLHLQQLFQRVYKKENVYFVNSTCEKFENDKMKNIYTEQNNVWNDSNIWKIGIDYIVEKINSNNIC